MVTSIQLPYIINATATVSPLYNWGNLSQVAGVDLASLTTPSTITTLGTASAQEPLTYEPIASLITVSPTLISGLTSVQQQQLAISLGLSPNSSSTDLTNAINSLLVPTGTAQTSSNLSLPATFIQSISNLSATQRQQIATALGLSPNATANEIINGINTLFTTTPQPTAGSTLTQVQQNVFGTLLGLNVNVAATPPAATSVTTAATVTIGQITAATATAATTALPTGAAAPVGAVTATPGIAQAVPATANVAPTEVNVVPATANVAAKAAAIVTPAAGIAPTATAEYITQIQGITTEALTTTATPAAARIATAATPAAAPAAQAAPPAAAVTVTPQTLTTALGAGAPAPAPVLQVTAAQAAAAIATAAEAAVTATTATLFQAPVPETEIRAAPAAAPAAAVTTVPAATPAATAAAVPATTPLVAATAPAPAAAVPTTATPAATTTAATTTAPAVAATPATPTAFNSTSVLQGLLNQSVSQIYQQNSPAAEYSVAGAVYLMSSGLDHTRPINLRGILPDFRSFVGPIARVSRVRSVV